MDLRYLLQKTVELKASDLHICAGMPPVVRINGELIYLDEPVMVPQDCGRVAAQCIVGESNKRLSEDGELDFSFALQGLARFRVNAFRQRGTIAMAFRVIPTKIPEISTLGLPKIVYELTNKQRGLILVTGPTGSGKSTTLASMIDYINRNKKTHIITIEDPIEFLHSHSKSVINQREIGSDTKSYANALRAALREDPDIILIGEMRDKETVEIALTAAETGHLVFSTLHTQSAAKTIDRIIDVFPPHQQAQIRTQLSTTLQATIAQQLLRKADGKSRVAATEVMICTSAISNLIREQRSMHINTAIHTGSELGMHSMDSCLAGLYKSGQITYETACTYASDIEGLKKIIN